MPGLEEHSQNRQRSRAGGRLGAPRVRFSGDDVPTRADVPRRASRTCTGKLMTLRTELGRHVLQRTAGQSDGCTGPTQLRAANPEGRAVAKKTANTTGVVGACW